MELRENPQLFERKDRAPLKRKFLLASGARLAVDIITRQIGQPRQNGSIALDYDAASRELGQLLDLKPESVVRQLKVIFPQERIDAGKKPAELAETFLEKNPSWFRQERIQKAVAAVKAGTTFTKAAADAGITQRTLSRYFTPGERISLTASRRFSGKIAKDRYTHIYSVAHIEQVADALKKHNGDRKKVVAELSSVIKRRRLTDLIRNIFPHYRVASLGIDGCVDNYKVWLAMNPDVRTTDKVQQEKRKRRLQEDPEYRARYVAKKQSEHKRWLATKKILQVMALLVEKDEEIKDKPLFMKVATEILRGKDAINIAVRNKIDQIAIIGVRRRMLSYLSARRFRTIEGGQEFLQTYLGTTKFWDTFRPEWVSARLRNVVTRQGENSGLESNVHSERVRKALLLAMSETRQLPQGKFIKDTVRSKVPAALARTRRRI